MQPPCSPLVETIDAPVVRQVMTHYRPIVPIQSTLSDLVDSLSFQSSRWLFVTDDDAIVGAVKTATLNNIIQRKYPLEVLQLSHFQHFPILFTTPDTPIAVLSQQLTPNTPVAIVQNTIGKAIGYVDLESQHPLQTRHQLNLSDVEVLLQYPWLQKISDIAAELDTPIYLIGGFVRDWFLNRSNDDIDFAIEGDVHKVADTLAQKYGGTVHHFYDFGGAHWITENALTIDLTVCRAEIYPSLSELPQVSSAHIDKDLERRDFNINAMAISLHPQTLGMLFDPFDGLKSLNARSFHTLHALSFFQDPTRIFRASRYAARFDFMPTALSIQQLHGALNVIQPGMDLTWTRIGIEIEKILNEPDPNRCFDCLREWGVIDAWMPFWKDVSFPLVSSLFATLAACDQQDTWWMLLALSIPAERHAELEGLIGLRSGALKRWQKLLHDLDLILHHLEGLHLQLPNIECTIGEALINSTLVHWLILEQRKPDIVPLLQWWIETGRHRTRSLTGKDLLAMGTPAGPMISDLLRIAQHAAWLGGDTDAERAAVLEHLSSTS